MSEEDFKQREVTGNEGLKNPDKTISLSLNHFSLCIQGLLRKKVQLAENTQFSPKTRLTEDSKSMGRLFRFTGIAGCPGCQGAPLEDPPGQPRQMTNDS